MRGKPRRLRRGGCHHFYGGPDDDPDVTTVVDPDERDHRAVVDYPLETFYGPGCLFAPTEPGPISADDIASEIGDVVEEGDIVVARNDADATGSKEDQYEEGGPPVPSFTEESARWLADRGVKAVVFGGVSLGATTETSNVVHDVLLSRGCVFVEIVDNVDAISRDRFTVMALPYKVDRIGSSFCRAVVIEKR